MQGFLCHVVFLGGYFCKPPNHLIVKFHQTSKKNLETLHQSEKKHVFPCQSEIYPTKIWLVVSTQLKKIVKWESSPNRGKNNKSLKPPPGKSSSFHYCSSYIQVRTWLQHCESPGWITPRGNDLGLFWGYSQSTTLPYPL